jgi:hypothetical protein
MTTFLIMQTRIADELVRDDLANQIKQAINSAIKTWEASRFSFNERRYLINTVANQEFYDTSEPTLLLHDGSALDDGEAIIEIDTIRPTINSQEGLPLTWRSQSWFDNFSITTTTGPPDSVGWYGLQLRFHPVPDTVYPVNIKALGRLGPNPLVADADTNYWMTEGEALIRHQAKYILYRDLLRDAEGKSAAAEGIQEAQWNLERKSSGKTYASRQAAWTL